MNESVDFCGEWGTVEIPQGKLVFCIEEECATIHEIEVSKRRCGIGSRLVSCLERFLVKQNVANIFVAATPTKQSLSFWLSCGFGYVFSEDIEIGKRTISYAQANSLGRTDSGIIAMERLLNTQRGNYEY